MPTKKSALPATYLQKPSITLDVAFPRPNGSVAQRRSTFSDFYDAIDELQAQQREWDSKSLPALKKAARVRR